MSRKTGLGRGLDALIIGDENLSPGRVSQIPVDHIIPNPRQPRGKINPEELAELAASIREHGVIQPIIVTHGDQTGRFGLIAGERRLLAAQRAGLKVIPAILREANEQQRLELALIENLQRTDLSPLEAAGAYHLLATEFGLSHEDISKRVGKSRTAITNTMRLLKLPQVVQQALSSKHISEGHARALLSLRTSQAQVAALETILSRGLNVRQTEDLVRKLSGQKPKPASKPSPMPEIIALEERLRSSLGTKVRLNRRRKGGTIVIHYYSDEELTSLVDQISGKSD